MKCGNNIILISDITVTSLTLNILTLPLLSLMSSCVGSLGYLYSRQGAETALLIPNSNHHPHPLIATLVDTVTMVTR